MSGHLEGPIPGAVTTRTGGVTVDEFPAGVGRVKRVIYPPGWIWSADMQPVTGTDTCQHVHIGFVVQGTIEVEFPDGCRLTYTAPAPVVIEAGHLGRVVGDEAVVLIQVDCGRDTEERFQLDQHSHAH